MAIFSRRAVLLAAGSAAMVPKAHSAPSLRATLYKEPGCDCCDGYARYLQKNFISVEVVASGRVPELNRAAGIPEDLAGCHVTTLDGYTVAGHAPIEAVRRLLADRPPLAAITLPGMPSGSPGMSGTATSPFIVYAISRDGSSPSVFSY